MTSRATATVPRLGDRQLRLVATAAAAVAVALFVVSLVVHRHLRSVAGEEAGSFPWADFALGAVWPVAGAVVVLGRPRNRCGWLLVAAGFSAVYAALGQYSLWNLLVAPLPGAAFADWVSMFGFAVYELVIPLVALLFPDGRLPSRRWRPFAWSLVVGAGMVAVGRALVPGPSDVSRQVQNPLGVEQLELLNYVVIVGAYWCIGIGVPVAVWSLLRRTRRAVGRDRAQLQWLLLGGVVLVLGVVATITLRTGGDQLFALGLLGPPVGIAVAVLRHRLFDVELVLSRSIVWTLLLALVGGGWAALTLRLDPALAGTRSGLVVVGLLAVLALAVRSGLQALVDRWWFPHRQGVRTLAPRVARAVASATGPREALGELVAALRTELRLPYAALRGPVTVEHGSPPDRVEQLDATAMGRDMGVLEVAPRRPGEGFGREERRLLEDAAAYAAMLAYAAVLVTDVEQSRSRIVLAREEERRRLRNDLHDGVGPGLAGIALQLDALAGRLERAGQPEASVQARGIRDRVRGTVAEVRAVSHGLRPPVLDQIGLAEALRQQVAGLAGIEGRTDLDDLSGIPAALEVAVHAVASESLANVVRHSAASRVRLEVERTADELVLRVADNGRGMPARPRPGVGLTSMRQRAAEVGGRVEHRPVEGGGTEVTLTVPLDSLTTAQPDVPPAPKEVSPA
ncbi:sensor histidine kinase [Nocardioides caldifontis]|uniref:sensor histidine kinase n=1 Tax=Nocardioides caldifontis TaxID=2588938 RepID=UPI0011E002C1|nr:sensor histidine kinase [Nocardioides caldifontis]